MAHAGSGRIVALTFADTRSSRPPDCSGGLLGFALVAHAGFEPAISALRGQCPGPLDECAPINDPRSTDRVVLTWLGMEDSNPHLRNQNPLSYH